MGRGPPQKGAEPSKCATRQSGRPRPNEHYGSRVCEPTTTGALNRTSAPAPRAVSFRPTVGTIISTELRSTATKGPAARV